MCSTRPAATSASGSGRAARYSSAGTQPIAAKPPTKYVSWTSRRQKAKSSKSTQWRARACRAREAARPAAASAAGRRRASPSRLNPPAPHRPAAARRAGSWRDLTPGRKRLARRRHGGYPRRMASGEFQVVMTKPTGALCNLDCRYCYYLDKRRLYPERESFRMPDDLLETYVLQHIEASPGELVTFAWHGGEPTILGLDYFRRIVALQKRHRPPGRRIVNNLQTNGTLLDEAWCRFLAAEGFFVGLSLDGPAEYHDRYRVTRGGGPTHRDVVRGWRLLQRHRVRSDVLCVVHAANVAAPTAVYRFFKELGVPSLQFLPLVVRTPAGVSERTPTAAAVGEFLCAVFDEWIRHDVGRVSVQMLDESVPPTYGLGPALCVFRETCGDVPVLEHNGDFYACDHFVDPAHRVGNIRETPPAALLASPAQRAVGAAKRDAPPPRRRQRAARAPGH